MGMRSYAQAGPGSTDRGAPDVDPVELSRRRIQFNLTTLPPTTKFTRGAVAQRTLEARTQVGRQKRRAERLLGRHSAVPFEARISALLSIFGQRRHCRFRTPGCAPVIAASVEICRHEKVICGAKEAVGQWHGCGLPRAQ
jgi:hypothetical protein